MIVLSLSAPLTGEEHVSACIACNQRCLRDICDVTAAKKKAELCDCAAVIILYIALQSVEAQSVTFTYCTNYLYFRILSAAHLLIAHELMQSMSYYE